MFDREFDRLIDNLFGGYGFKVLDYPGVTIRMGNIADGKRPPIRYDHPVEYTETEDGCMFEIFALGMKKDDIEVKLEPVMGLDVLKVSGTTGEYFIRDFQNTIKFRPDYNKIECDLDSGILTVRLYKDKEKSPDSKVVWK